MIGFAGHVAAALAWVALAVLLTARGQYRGIGRLLVAAVVLEAVWAGAMAASLTSLSPPRELVLGVEALRPLGWTALLLAMFAAPGDARRRAILGSALLGRGTSRDFVESRLLGAPKAAAPPSP